MSSLYIWVVYIIELIEYIMLQLFWYYRYRKLKIKPKSLEFLLSLLGL